MTVHVSAVPTEHIPAIWPMVRPLIEKAVNYSHGRYETDDVLDVAQQPGHNLWIAFEDETIKGAVVTRNIAYPRKQVLYVMFLGGAHQEGDTWKEPMLALLRKWARDTGCSAIEATGRAGWYKEFESDGAKLLSQTFEIPVDTEVVGDT